MKPILLLALLSFTVVLAGFGPHVRIDHQYDPAGRCHWEAITVGPSAGTGQPLYVVFEYDSALIGWRADIMFQKSTDAGRTWLPADVVAAHGDPGAVNPDIATDRDGNIFVSYNDGIDTSKHVYCVRSTDGGATWSSPARVDDKTSGGIGLSRVTADSAGNLLCAWNDGRTGWFHIWSSVSTDRGATWRQNVLVDDDTVHDICAQPDVFVQPGTNHYLVAAQAPCPDGHLGCYLYRSTDLGQTFEPGVQLDTLDYAGQPHVVADVQCVICNYTGNGVGSWARTLYTQPDTWGSPYFVGQSYVNGAKLAISADGRAHTALMDGRSGLYLISYAFSSDQGVSWSDPGYVNDDTTAEAYDPDIAVDSAGHAYIVWRDYQSDEIWFATNDPAGIAEQPVPQSAGLRPSPTVVRGVLFLPTATSPKLQAASLLDISGRQVVALKPGANDVSRLSPGVYFVRLSAGGKVSTGRITLVR